jgi:hypothetical protein
MEHIDRVIHLSEEQYNELVANGKITVNGEEKKYSDNALYIVPNAMYPVGAVYISTVETSPALLFGGTWEKIEGKFLLSASSEYTAGSVGGSADAVVVRHDGHHPGYWGGNNWNGVGNEKEVFLPTSIFTPGGNANGWEIDGGEAYPANVAKGEDGTGKNMPPYLAVYMWKRIA